jgi:hypothetical protein
MNLAIYGAGAIGRGFIPWVFPPEQGFKYYFVDTKLSIKGYNTYIIRNGEYKEMHVTPSSFSEADAIISAVGQRNFMYLSDKFNRLPVVCCENDSRLPEEMTGVNHNHNIFFAIPDVITSNTAPPHLLDKDPLSIVTEDGTLYIDNRMSWLGGNAKYLDSKGMYKEWKAKLYLHNTPHCIAAYLGYELGYEYIHEAMGNDYIQEIVTKVLDETTRMVVNRYDIDKGFAEWYAQKEISRFSNPLLFDPIKRVAREPLRKLAVGERLIGAARLCVQSNLTPHGIARGIMSALHYDEPTDPDYEKIKNMTVYDLGLDADEPLMYILDGAE